MSADIFAKIQENRGPLGIHAERSHGYFTFPKLEGEISPHMEFRGTKMLNWSLNNYLGLANDPEVRKYDAEVALEYGFSHPMGARMMSGNSDFHEKLEAELSEFVEKEDTILCNFGYQAVLSVLMLLLTERMLLFTMRNLMHVFLMEFDCIWEKDTFSSTMMLKTVKNN